MGDKALAASSLVDLGLSQYESQAYVGLLALPPSTGYALANATGIPQPKVYETLRRLAEKGYVAKIDDDPALYIATPPERLLRNMEDDLHRKLADARAELDQLLEGAEVTDVVVTQVDSGWEAVRARARQLINGSQQHVYVSGYTEHVEQLGHAVQQADERGVRFDLLTFGQPPFDLLHGDVVPHEVTASVIYRHHQDRHLAIVADSTSSMWALAPDGANWSGLCLDGRLLASLVKEYIRHDLYVQRIFTEFREPLEKRFGPGLQQLVVRQATPTSARGTRRAQSGGRKRASRKGA